jgi:hypothetical protein
VENPEIAGEDRVENAKEKHNGCRRRKGSEWIRAETEKTRGFDGEKIGK